MKNHKSGFTLIELLVVIAIIGILASIAYPAYTEFLKQGRRSIVQSELLSLASAMNQYYVQNGSTYTGAGVVNSAPTIYPGDVEIKGVVVYKLTISALSSSAYTLKATPQAGTSQADDGYLTLDNAGTRVWTKGLVSTNWDGH